MLNREILPKIWAKIDTSEIILLNGPRQVGKTTLLKQIKEKLIKEKKAADDHIFWFDLEKSEDLLIWSNQTNALDALPTVDKKNKYYLFIDEFQKSETIGSILKVIHDHHPNFKVIITGSASWYLNIDESMAGRKRVFSVWPLGFNEFLEQAKMKNIKTFYNLVNKNTKTAGVKELELVNKAFIEFITYGGYPAVVLAEQKKEKEAIVSEIINSYILQDIKLYNYAANTLQVKNILTLLADRVGSLLDITNLSLNVGLGRAALVNRLDLLQNTFVLNLVAPYFTNKTKELVKNPKIFLVDAGLRNQLLENFFIQPQTQNFGQLAENFVLTELIKNENDSINALRYWRAKNGNEVDIIIKRENKLIPIEVKGGNENSIPDGLRSFIGQYQPPVAYVLNWSIIQDIKYQNTLVKFRPLWFRI